MIKATRKQNLVTAGSPDGIHSTGTQAVTNIKSDFSLTATQAGSPAAEQGYFEPLIGADEASAYIGFQPITILRMAAKGLLPCVAFPIGKTGKYRYKFKMSELEAYVVSLSRPAKAA